MIAVRRSAGLLFVCVAAACFEEPSYEGRRCFSNEPCPSGYTCGADERCTREGDAGIVDAGRRDASVVEPERCGEMIEYPRDGWEARFYLLPRDPEIIESNCFGVERMSGVELHRDFMFDGPTPEILTFASRYTATRSLVGALEFAVAHDDGLRVFAGDRAIYDKWSGPMQDPARFVHYFARGDYRLRAEHWDSGGAADVQLGWRPVCAGIAAPRDGWSLSFHRLDAQRQIDLEDCFGVDSVPTSPLSRRYSVKPDAVEIDDGYAMVAKTIREFDGATRVIVAHDDGLRVTAGSTLIYEDLAAGSKRNTVLDVSLSGELEVIVEAYDYADELDVTVTF